MTDASGELRGISEIVLLDVVAAGSFSDSRVREVTGDIADPDVMRRVVDSNTSSIFHLAAVVSGQAEAQTKLGVVLKQRRAHRACCGDDRRWRDDRERRRHHQARSDVDDRHAYRVVPW